MINAVSSFFPNSIGRSLPSVQQSASTAQSNAVFAPAQTYSGSSLTSSFADKLQTFFTLSPSDFSALFGSLGGGSGSSVFPDVASAAYTQSALLTASRLSVNV